MAAVFATKLIHIFKSILRGKSALNVICAIKICQTVRRYNAHLIIIILQRHTVVKNAIQVVSHAMGLIEINVKYRLE